MDAQSLVRLDEPASWPVEFASLVSDLAAGADDEPFFDQDVELRACACLTGRRLAAYHCTRLTEREIGDVRERGLRPLSNAHRAERIRAATADGHLSPQLAEQLLGQADSELASRFGQVWAFTDRRSLLEPGQIGWLVSAWGGEAINMALGTRSPEMREVEKIGVPTVVRLGLDLELHNDYAHPGVAAAAVRQLASGDGGTSICGSATISPDHILATEHPGGTFWDRYVWTPDD